MANDLASVTADLEVAQVQLYLLREVEREQVDVINENVVQVLNQELLDLTSVSLVFPVIMREGLQIDCGS